MVTIVIPGPFRVYTENQKAVEVRGTTVGDALENLTSLYPGIRPQIYDEQNNLLSSIHIFLKEQEVSTLQGEKTQISNGDRLIVAIPIAGG